MGTGHTLQCTVAIITGQGYDDVSAAAIAEPIELAPRLCTTNANVNAPAAVAITADTLTD